jgi:transposase
MEYYIQEFTKATMITLHYVGMDVHKGKNEVVALRENETIPYIEKRILNRTKSIKKVSGNLLSEGCVIACYEAGFMGFTLQCELEGMDVITIVAAPGKPPRKSSERIKTDRRDARTLATYLRNGDIEAVHIPTVDKEVVWDYLRPQEDTRLDLVSTKQRLQRFLLRHGYVYESSRYWTGRHEKWLHTLEFVTPLMKATFDEYYFGIKGLEEKLRMIEKWIEEIALSEP